MYDPPRVLASDALTKLRELGEQRHRDPQVTLQGATALLTAAGGFQVEATAHQVIGLAHFELSRVVESVASLRRAVAVSAEHG